MRTNAKTYIVSALIYIFVLPSLVFPQAEVIGDGDILSPPWDWKKIPVYRFIDDMDNMDTLWAVTMEFRYPDDDVAYCHVRYPWDGWDNNYFIPSVNSTAIEFYVDSAGNQFYYDAADDVLMMVEEEIIWTYRDCPGRPVFDSENNIHVIWEGGTDTLFYGFSTDSLSTFETVDTLFSMPPFLRLAASPDNSIVGAVFYDDDADSLYKYLAVAGESLDFLIPGDVVYFNPEGVPDFNDMVLNRNGEIYLELRKDSGHPPWYWGLHHFWSESYGFRFLRPSGDDYQDGTIFEICFGPNEDEILLIDSRAGWHYGSEFYYSSDGGNAWYLSSFEIAPAYFGSAPRVFSDTIDFVYSDYSQSYYYPIPRDSIIENLTDVVGESEPISLQISLSNYPNPFNSSTNISFTLPEAGHVKLDVYDIAGRLVTTLVDPDAHAGHNTVIWNGTDQSGRPISSGIYFYTLRSGNDLKSRRMLLLK